MKVAVIGAAGQVGSAIVRALGKERDLTPVAIVRHDVAAQAVKVLSKAEVRVGAMNDASTAANLLAGCEAAINCSIATGLPAAARAANERVVGSIAAAARQGMSLSTFVHLSTVGVYGLFHDPVLGGSFDRPRPDTAYGRDKLQMEHVVHGMLPAPVRPFVLRVGHVYGPHQSHSKAFLDLLRHPRFAVPFEGRHAANAIHAERLARSIAELIRRKDGLPAGTYNALDAPNSSWKDLLALHAEASGLPLPRLLDDSESQAMRSALVARSKHPLLGELKTLASGVGSALGAVATMPALRDVALAGLSRAPQRLEQAIKHRYVLWSSRKNIGALRALDQAVIPVHLFSAGVPGPCLADHLGAQPPTWDEAKSALGAWVSSTLSPTWRSSLATSVQGNAHARL
jgi:nucleoside-diphosphate-sugar epimerase